MKRTNSENQRYIISLPPFAAPVLGPIALSIMLFSHTIISVYSLNVTV